LGIGTMQGKKFLVEAKGGALETLRESSQDYPLTLKIIMGSTKVVIDGAIKDPINLTGVNASLDISGLSFKFEVRQYCLMRIK
jgi:hypothetical protein